MRQAVKRWPCAFSSTASRFLPLFHVSPSQIHTMPSLLRYPENTQKQKTDISVQSLGTPVLHPLAPSHSSELQSGGSSLPKAKQKGQTNRIFSFFSQLELRTLVITPIRETSKNGKKLIYFSPELWEVERFLSRVETLEGALTERGS